MKKSIIAFLLPLVLFSSCSEDDIEPIKKECKEIDKNLTTYRLKSVDVAAKPGAAGAIIGYLTKTRELVKATVESSDDKGRKFEEYYFDDGKIACVRQISFVYNKPQYYTRDVAQKNGDSTWFDDHKTLEKTTTFYFYDNRMIKWINDENKVVPDNDRSFEFQRAVLLRDVGKLQKMLAE